VAQTELEIRFQPDSSLYVYETRGMGTAVDLYTAVIQNFAIINHLEDNVIIDEVIIQAFKDDILIQIVFVDNEILKQSAKKFKAYESQGVLEFYDFQFQTSRYLKDVSLSETLNLSQDHAVIVSHSTLLFQSLPDKVLVKVKGHISNSKEVQGEESLKVINHVSNNEYHFPLKGRWFALGAPSLISHHRWGSIQEFAFDLVKISTNGSTFTGDGSKLSQYYSYGESIYAIGDGKVVASYNGSTESDKNLRQPDETVEDYMNRTTMEQQKLLAKGFSNVLGNHIIIEHENGEYSHYLHLKTNSLKVNVNDLVSRGQPIAELGHSGNSTEPHLHFHVTDSPDMSYSRSLPVTFKNIEFYPDDDGTLRHIHYGQIIITKD
jgi:hypothetical protein